MQFEEYNGYSSRETWLVGLWLDGNYTGEGTPCGASVRVPADEPHAQHDQAAAVEAMPF